MARLAKALSAAAGSAGGDKVYVEDVFSTDVYTGNNSAQTITTGLDISGEGGTIWFKQRVGTESHRMLTTTSATYKYVQPDTTDVEQTVSTAGGNNPGFGSVTSTGFTLVADDGYSFNKNDKDMVAWSFRKQKGFFDIVTYTGDGSSARTISHNLGCKPGMIMVKRTDASADWQVWHRYTGLSYGVAHLNSYLPWTNTGGDNAAFYDANGSATNFTLGQGSRLNDTNQNGATYIAYLFAGQGDADSQIFGDDGDEAIVKCGSYQSTGNGDEVFVDLGFEPQWIMIKSTTDTNSGYSPFGQPWLIQDTMRGMAHQSINPYLLANTNGAENSVGTGGWARADASGVTIGVAGAINMFNSVQTYTYMAIRRGPMKEPDAGTDVFQPIATSGDNPNTTTATFPWDTQFNTFTNTAYSGYNNQINDRLRGVGFLPSFTTTPHLTTANRDAQTVSSSFLALKGNGMDVDKSTGWGASSTTIFHNFRRYPKVFDVVVYTAGTGPGVTSGDGTSSVVPHNLTVAPELIIGKDLDDGGAHWGVAFTSQGNGNSGQLNTDAAISGGSILNSTNPTATSLNVSGSIAGYGNRNVLLLFSTLAGISKVGTYSGTGTGTTVDVDCGFSAGARYILIKRTDSTGDWFVYDSARGIVSGDSPYILLNSTAGQVNTDYIDPLSSGFQVTTDAAVTSTLNVSGATYAFLAIA